MPQKLASCGQIFVQIFQRESRLVFAWGVVGGCSRHKGHGMGLFLEAAEHGGYHPPCSAACVVLDYSIATRIPPGPKCSKFAGPLAQRRVRSSVNLVLSNEVTS